MLYLQFKCTREKVELALKQIASLKSHSLNGFNLGFYQTYWHIVGDEITSVVLNFLNVGLFEKEINFTYIVFIPKVQNPLIASDFCHISLCNLIYKIVSKVMVNRLKQVFLSYHFKESKCYYVGKVNY